MTAPPQPDEPDGEWSNPPQRSPATSSGRWFGQLSKGVKWIVGVFLVALIGALVTALVATLLPPGELTATLNDVSIDRNVTLTEYDLRYRDEKASTQDGSRATVRVPTVLIAQTLGEETATPTTSPGASPTISPGASPTISPGTPTGDDDTVLRLKLDGPAQKRLDTGVRNALDDERVPANLDIGAACERDLTAPDCGLSTLQSQLKIVEEDGTPGAVKATIVARQLVTIFRGTRTHTSTSGKRVPVGVTINFTARLTGFRGKRADVRWSLFSAKSGRRVPQDWLKNQRGATLKGTADTNDRSSQFWAPVPRSRGPYFIRVGIYDEDDARLDYANTEPFR